MTKQKITNQTERRYLNFEASKLEYRGEGDNKKPYVVGHAAVFNSLSENLGGFRELIQTNAFDDVLEDDVRALFNHDANLILARTKSGTLNLSVDDKGLRYEFDVPNTTAGRDLLVSLERGDVSQSSFGFTVAEDNWDEDKEGRWVRNITKVKRLYDVSPVVYPAYPAADVAKRSLQEAIQKRKNDEVTPHSNLDMFKHKINLLKLKA
tara:strand:+ start:3590 stop:4213 length:624 start_codon:yes stop_codon:yes gene_type:complete